MSPRNLIPALLTFSSGAIHAACGVGECCRFSPTCSRYAKEAFRRHSFWYAFRLTLLRLMRCHPWGSFGLDLVPQKVRRT